MKRDKSSVKRNPRTVNRIANQIMQMDLGELYMKCSRPKETNRQIGPMFKKWVETGVLGFPLKGVDAFANNNEDAMNGGFGCRDEAVCRKEPWLQSQQRT